VYAEYLQYCANNKLHNLSRAYLDSEKRVAELVELVKDLARQQREEFYRMDYYEITAQELARIMGKETHDG
jgi:DNA-directed RNA polymerase specialized sigma24 family protein